jgi:hypothetical protein
LASGDIAYPVHGGYGVVQGWARREWRGSRVEIEDPDESLESVGSVGKLCMSVARCLVGCGRLAWSSGLDSVKTSSSCGDRARDGSVVEADLPECTACEVRLTQRHAP